MNDEIPMTNFIAFVTAIVLADASEVRRWKFDVRCSTFFFPDHTRPPPTTASVHCIIKSFVILSSLGIRHSSLKKVQASLESPDSGLNPFRFMALNESPNRFNDVAGQVSQRGRRFNPDKSNSKVLFFLLRALRLSRSAGANFSLRNHVCDVCDVTFLVEVG